MGCTKKLQRINSEAHMRRAKCSGQQQNCFWFCPHVHCTALPGFSRVLRVYHIFIVVIWKIIRVYQINFAAFVKFRKLSLLFYVWTDYYLLLFVVRRPIKCFIVFIVIICILSRWETITVRCMGVVIHQKTLNCFNQKSVFFLFRKKNMPQTEGVVGSDSVPENSKSVN